MHHSDIWHIVTHHAVSLSNFTSDVIHPVMKLFSDIYQPITKGAPPTEQQVMDENRKRGQGAQAEEEKTNTNLLLSA
jgi:hypothetical protein